MSNGRFRVIDDRGRVLGRINLIDVAAIGLLLVLLPLGYATYRMFRVPPPEIVSVDPGTLILSGNMRIKVVGEHFRPFLRAYVGDRLGDFLVQRPNLGEVQVPPDLPPGTYDLALFDEGREVARRTDAIVLRAPKLPDPPLPPTMSVGVLGSFTNLDRAAVTNLPKWKSALPPFLGRLLSMSPPEPQIERLEGQHSVVIASGGAADRFRVRAFFQVPCAVVGTDCKSGTVLFAPDASIPVETKQGSLTFHVESLHPIAPTGTAEVKVSGKFGDLDRAQAASLFASSDSERTLPGGLGRILSVGSPESDLVDVRGRTGLLIGAGATGKQRTSALIAIRCTMTPSDCRFGDTIVSPAATLSVPTRQGVLTFQVDALYPVEPSRTAEVTVNGRFVDLDAARAASLSGLSQADRALPGGLGRILSLGAPEPDHVELKDKLERPAGAGATGKLKVDARIAIRCTVGLLDCRFGEIPIQLGQVLSVPTRRGVIRFVVSELSPHEVTPVQLTMRCAIDPLLLPRLREQLERDASVADPLQRRLLAMSDVRENVPIQVSSSAPNDRATAYGWEERGTTLTIVVRVPAQKIGASELQYGGAPLRAGERFAYSGPSFTVAGTIVAVNPQPPDGR